MEKKSLCTNQRQIFSSVSLSNRLAPHTTLVRLMMDHLPGFLRRSQTETGRRGAEFFCYQFFCAQKNSGRNIETFRPEKSAMGVDRHH
jgi:hypothetical protein